VTWHVMEMQWASVVAKRRKQFVVIGSRSQ
jgi:hypothetical protein